MQHAGTHVTLEAIEDADRVDVKAPNCAWNKDKTISSVSLEQCHNKSQ